MFQKKALCGSFWPNAVSDSSLIVNHGAGEGEPTLEEIQSQLADLQAENTRLKGHNDKVLGEKKTAATALKEAQQQLAQFDGIDVESVSNMMKQFKTDEDAKLIAEGKWNEVLSKHTERLVLDSKAQVEEYEKSISERDGKITSLQQKYDNMVIDTALRSSAEKAGVLPEAIDFALDRSRGLFSLNEEGKLESRDSDGNLRTVGNKALTPDLQMEVLKDSAAFLWGSGDGAGAGGGSRKKNDNVNPFMKGSKHFNMTEQAKLRKSDPAEAERLMKLAANAG